MSEIKSANKRTLKERLAQERQQGILLIENNLPFLNEPTYYFTVGEEVQYGNLKNCVIKEVLYNGKVYGLIGKAISNNYGHPYTYQIYKIAPWMDVRPISHENTSFANNQISKLIFQNSTLESLIHLYYYFGIDTKSDYHREDVWEHKDKELLIDSIFHNIDTGKIAINHLSKEERLKRNAAYEVIDGKQRISAFIDFYENRFEYKGKSYNNLSWMDKRVFKNYTLHMAIAEEAEKRDILKYFLMLNRTGKELEELHLKKIKSLLKEEESIII